MYSTLFTSGGKRACEKTRSVMRHKGQVAYVIRLIQGKLPIHWAQCALTLPLIDFPGKSS